MSAYVKGIITLSCSLLFAITLNMSAYAEEFLSVLPDIPLPAGMHEIVDSQMSFDSTTGRIIQVVANGKIPQSHVEEFYQVTLPQLGWTAKSADIYSRELEQLKLSFSSENSVTELQFELSPKTDMTSN